MGECPHDFGGYFVIDGAEKTLVAREDLVNNRLYIRPADKSSPELTHIGYMRSATHDDTFPRTMTFYAKTVGTISVVVTHLGKTRTQGGGFGVPIFVIFRALGIDSDLDILRRIVMDVDSPEEHDIVNFLRLSLVECARLGVMDQASAIRYLTPMVVKGYTLKHILMWDLLPNAGASFATKALFLGRAVRQLVGTILGKIDPLERDDYVNKRVTVSGHLMADLFRDVLLRVRRQWVRRLESEWTSGSWRANSDPTRMVTSKNLRSIFEGAYLSERLRKSMKGSWGANDEPTDDVEMADNAANGALVQDLSRISYLSTIAHIRRVNNTVDRDIKMSGPHELRASHWGVLCPSDTPDGPNIGLVSHLASTALITMGGDGLWSSAIKVVQSKVTPVASIASDDIAKFHKQCKVFVDDTWMGVTPDPPELIAHLREQRRLGAFGDSSFEISFSWRIVERELHVQTDRGRVLRPVAVVRRNAAGVPQLPLPLWEDKEKEAAVETLDVEELRTRLVAMTPSDIAQKSHTHRYTHCELVPSRAMFSVLTETIPLVEYNGAARVTFALAQLKQAICIYSTAFRTRVDTAAYVLHRSQMPMVTTRAAHELWGGQHGTGTHLVVAVCTYTGYNVEDALILNRGSVDRGLFALTCYDTLRFEESASEDRVVSFGIPIGSKRSESAFRHLGEDGLPKVGAHVRVGDVLVGRTSTAIGAEDVSIVATAKTCGVVDRVISYAASRPWKQRGSRERAIKVRMRHGRRPEPGDKLASRFSQKGVVGMILPEEDMPFCGGSGVVPDVIFNPHSIPSRYTPSHLIETLLGKAAAAAGIQRYDTTAFEGSDPVAEATARLEALGMDLHGHEVMYNGFTGEAMSCDIYVGIMAARFGTPTDGLGSGTEKEFRDAICLCGTSGCRGSFLTFSGSRAFQAVMNERHNVLHRQAIILHAGD
jgi:DNA-directed RNA polymerase II subunit RPB2